MKPNLLLTKIAYLMVSRVSPQCVRNIRTNPEALINDEFLE